MLIYLQAIGDPQDRTRFEAMYSAYRGLMFHVANRILQNPQDAEDCGHDFYYIEATAVAELFDVTGGVNFHEEANQLEFGAAPRKKDGQEDWSSGAQRAERFCAENINFPAEPKGITFFLLLFLVVIVYYCYINHKGEGVP